MAEGGAATALATCFWREFEHQDPPGGGGGGLQSPPDTGTSGSRKTWGGGQWGPIIHSIGQGKSGERFTASLKFATFF